VATRERTHSSRHLAKLAAGPLIATLAVCPILVRQIVVLNPAGLLATEGKTSFYVDTAAGLVEASFGDPARALWPYLTASLFVVPIVAAFALGWLYRRGGARSKVLLRDGVIVLTLLVGVSALSIIQHYVVGAAYLSGRRAISLIPLVFLVLAAATAAASSARSSWGGGVRATAIVLCLFVLGLQVRNVSVDVTRAWWFDADTRDMMKDLKCLIDQRWTRPEFRLALPWELEPGANYYRTHLPIHQLVALDRGGLRPGFDAYFMPRSDVPEVDRSMMVGRASLGSLLVLKHYPRTHGVLAVPSDSPLIVRQSAGSHTNNVGMPEHCVSDLLGASTGAR